MFSYDFLFCVLIFETFRFGPWDEGFQWRNTCYNYHCLRVVGTEALLLCIKFIVTSGSWLLVNVMYMFDVFAVTLIAADILVLRSSRQGSLFCCVHFCASYTGCPRRNVKYFGRVFLVLNYTDITQNTYIQS